MKLLFLSMLLMVFLSGCVMSPQREQATPSIPVLATLYDVVLYDSSTKRPISLKQLATTVSDADVVFVGEYHGSHASHWFQAQLQAALFKQRPQQILSMEQFSRDKQGELDHYLNSEIGEVALLQKAEAWPNYTASYRPLVEFAKQQKLAVIAANAPADIVRCIGRQGEAWLSKLTALQRVSLANQPFMNNDDYQAEFQKVMHAPAAPAAKGKQALSNSYLAQLSRDNTMAESIIQSLAQHQKHQVIHVNGAFHSDSGLGTVALLKQRRPDLKVVVISPVEIDSYKPAEIPFTKGDYVYLLKPQPEQYANDTEREAAFKSMFSKAATKTCQ